MHEPPRHIFREASMYHNAIRIIAISSRTILGPWPNRAVDEGGSRKRHDLQIQEWE